MSQLQNDINDLEEERKLLVLKRDDAATSEQERIAIRGEIAGIDNRLANLERRGKFSPPVSIVFSHILLFSII